MGKDRFAKNTQRFADVPREPAVYIAELLLADETLVKVGACGNARGRMMSLQSEVKRVHGAELGEFTVVTKPTAKAAYEAETNVLRLMNKLGKRVEGHREFFTGVTYDVAACVAEVLLKSSKRRVRSVNPSLSLSSVGG